MSGTWIKINAVCTTSIPVLVARCNEWADHGSWQCDKWADEGSNQCEKWADEGHKECCDWWPCSWACDAFYWVANWVCQAWYWVAKWVCKAWYWLAKWVCISWSILFFWLCLGEAKGGPLFLLTDGTILMNENNYGFGTRHWWKLTPDNNGSYINGTWSPVADSKNARKYFASAILADGRLLVCGGEYSDASGTNKNDETNLCEIYDPVANTWTSINAPAGWTEIGDGACSLLPDGRFLLGNLSSKNNAIFDPTTGTWTSAANKIDISSEESWVLLADGTILTPQCFGHPQSEKYVIAKDTWTLEDNLPVELVEFGISAKTKNISFEIGPAVLLPDGRAFFVGATSATAIFTPPAVNTARGTWTAGPAIPMVNRRNLGSKDGPASLMVNGNVLFPAAPVDGNVDNYLKPCSFFEFDGTNITSSTNVPNNDCPTFVGRLMLLPTGEIMWAREDDSSFYAFQYQGVPNNKWRPVINFCPNNITVDTIIQITGTQFNGLSQAVGYGDDYTAATNYPLVRILNKATGHVRYCRTSNHTTTDAAGNTITSMGVATGNAVITTTVQIPADIETGLSEFYVVANGIASDPCIVTIFPREIG